MTKIELRLATVEDAKAINAIYEPYILNTPITFEYEPVKDQEFAERIEKILTRFPYLVCEIDSKIVGYSYLSSFKERAAFGWDTEITVYLQPEYQKRGIASAFYEAMIRFAKEMGYYNIYALITHTNEKSIGFHEKFRFTQVGYYPNTGYKFGQWWGLDVLCRTLRKFDKTPKNPKMFNELDSVLINEVLLEAELKIKM